jgi:hypothetical protein
LGAFVGYPKLGRQIGQTAGQLFSHITGLGDYKINGNSLTHN